MISSAFILAFNYDNYSKFYLSLDITPKSYNTMQSESKIFIYASVQAMFGKTHSNIIFEISLSLSECIYANIGATNSSLLENYSFADNSSMTETGTIFWMSI